MALTQMYNGSLAPYRVGDLYASAQSGWQAAVSGLSTGFERATMFAESMGSGFRQVLNMAEKAANIYATLRGIPKTNNGGYKPADGGGPKYPSGDYPLQPFQPVRPPKISDED